MFIGREKELRQLNAELSSWKRKTAVLVYGKRRVGKNTLLIALQYFHRAAMRGLYPDIDDFGSYWYDDPAAKTNGRFDCVIRRGEQYDFYECKYFDRPMTFEECRQDKEQLDSIRGHRRVGRGICLHGWICVRGC